MPFADKRYYDGLSYPRERAVLRAWFKLHESRYENYLFNFRVGEGRDPGTGFPDYARRNAIQNSQSRIDVLAWSGSRVTIIEVKDRALSRQVGQLVAYSVLWRKFVQQRGLSDFQKSLGFIADWPASLPFDPEPSLLLVTSQIDNDAILVFQQSGARVDVVTPDPQDPDWQEPRQT